MGDLVTKDGSPRMEVQVSTQEAKWKQIQYGYYSATAPFLVIHLQSHLYSLSPIPTLFPFYFLPPSSPFFILFALSVLEVKTRTLYVLGKLFYH